MGQIRGFFRSDFSAFGAGAPNALKSDLKIPGFVPFRANLANFEINLTSLQTADTSAHLTRTQGCQMRPLSQIKTLITLQFLIHVLYFSTL